MGTLLDVEPLPLGVAYQKFVRIKVEFDFSLPLKTRFLFPHSIGKPATTYLNMKNFIDFCYHCGRIGYSISIYSYLQFVSPFDYGPELRADPLEIRKVSHNVFFGPSSDHHSSTVSTTTPLSTDNLACLPHCLSHDRHELPNASQGHIPPIIGNYQSNRSSTNSMVRTFSFSPIPSEPLAATNSPASNESHAPHITNNLPKNSLA